MKRSDFLRTTLLAPVAAFFGVKLKLAEPEAMYQSYPVNGARILAIDHEKRIITVGSASDLYRDDTGSWNI